MRTIILLILFFFGVVFLLLIRYVVPSFLAYHHPVKSHNLLIEAWISAREMEQAVEYSKERGGEFHFYLTGYIYSDDSEKSENQNIKNSSNDDPNNGIWLLTNSTVQVKIPRKVHLSDTTKIEIFAEGNEVAGHGAYFNLIANEKVLGGQFIKHGQQSFCFRLIRANADIESLYIRFVNDLWTGQEDRNFHITGLNIDGQPVPLSGTNTLITEELNSKTTGFNSQAEEMAQYLVALGIDPEQITAVPFEKAKRNQTRAAAKQFGHLIVHDSIPSVNLVTSGFHSRRTWVTYRSTIPDRVNLGVIYFPSESAKQTGSFTQLRDYLLIFEEFLSYLSNWIVIHL